MLIRGVVDDEFGNHPKSTALRLGDEAAKILHRAEIRIDGTVVGDVIAIVVPWRRIERQKPKRGDAQFLKIIEFACQADEVADTIVVAVGEGLDVKLIDDGVLVPEIAGLYGSVGTDLGHFVHDKPHARQRNKSAGSRSGSILKRTPPHSIA